MERDNQNKNDKQTIFGLKLELINTKLLLGDLKRHSKLIIHNERGAGRKPKVDKETAAEIFRLSNEGRSLSQIVNFVEQNTGIRICKTTAYNIVNKMLKEKE